MTESTPADDFPTATDGLAEAAAPQQVELADGDRFELEIAPVRKQLGDAEVRMLAYNGSIPGPVLVVDEGAEIKVVATNRGDLETTVHWHGIRLRNEADGVPGGTQDPIQIGDSYACRVQFPDPGIYWYHPHLREDFAQGTGLYGAIIVRPRDAAYWLPADRELAITLGDVLIEDGRMVPFGRSGPTFTAMGRFGNTMLINGQTEFADEVHAGQVLRLHLVNTANTRIFNVAVTGARMKLVGGDSGRHEREELIEAVLLSPSERVSVDVLFDKPGDAHLEHRTPGRTYDLGVFTVKEASASNGSAAAFEELRVDPELTAIRESIAEHLNRDPDKVLKIHSEMPILHGDEASEMSAGEGHAHAHGGQGDGLEWEDLMPEINRETDDKNMVWQLVDEDGGARNDEITWDLQVGDRVKIRLVNGMDQEHPMHHPFHIHGAGRFVVLSRDGEPERNLVWKDTVLIRADQTVDILLDVTNPGRWMAHCHIAEHTEVGMMFSFDVEP